MDWFVVDKKYINYLTQFDSRVGYVEYGERLKLHVGILLTIGDFHYYVPISSAKPKHQKMSNSLDFHKLQDESTGYLYAVLNINNMIFIWSMNERKEGSTLCKMLGLFNLNHFFCMTT